MRLTRTVIKRAPPGVRRVIRSIQSWRVRRSPFFRTYPYEGKLTHFALDLHTCVDFNLNIMFHRIPKVANSSLGASIASLKGARGDLESQAAKRALRHEMTLPSSLTTSEVAAVPSLFKFLFVRNPYDRLLSAYLSKVRPSHPGTGDICSGTTPTFREFCHYLRDGGLYDNVHWAPQSAYLALSLEEYDFVGKFEHLDRDFNEVARCIVGVGEVKPLVKEDTSHATAANKQRDEYYTKDLYGIVYELYELDFVSFGYAR